MYQGTLEAISNRADWITTLEIINDDTGAAITDLTGAVIKITVKGDGRQVLHAETGDGHFTDMGNGTVQCRFAASEMAGLCRGSYEVGMTLFRDDGTSQLLIATLPIIDGIVR